MKAKLIAYALIGTSAFAPCAWAQEGLATSSSVQGHNTIQQAPSGGRVGGAVAGTAANSAPQGTSNAEERDIERRNNAATQICKGC